MNKLLVAKLTDEYIECEGRSLANWQIVSDKFDKLTR